MILQRRSLVVGMLELLARLFQVRSRRFATMSLLLHESSSAPSRNTAKRYPHALVLLILVGGCRLLDFDSCLYEIRAIEVAGTVTQGGAELLYGRVNVGEQRDYQPDKSMQWELRGASLQGHVTLAALRDAADESKTLFVFSQTGGATSSGYVTQSGGANLNGFFDVLAAGRALIDVRTDIPGRESIRLIPTKIFQQDWTRPKCG